MNVTEVIYLSQVQNFFLRSFQLTTQAAFNSKSVTDLHVVLLLRSNLVNHPNFLISHNSQQFSY